MKYDANEQGFEIRDADVEIVKVLIKKPTELTYWFEFSKDGEKVPYAFNKDKIDCEWDGKTEPFEFALNHFKTRPEVTVKETA